MEESLSLLEKIKRDFEVKEVDINTYSPLTLAFIGDSITEGKKNGYHPWFETIINYFNNKKIIKISKGSFTTK